MMEFEWIISPAGDIHYDVALSYIQNPLLRKALTERENHFKNQLCFASIYLSLYYENYFYYHYYDEFVRVQNLGDITGWQKKEIPPKTASQARMNFYGPAFHQEILVYLDANERGFLNALDRSVMEYVAAKDLVTFKHIDLPEHSPILTEIYG